MSQKKTVWILVSIIVALLIILVAFMYTKDKVPSVSVELNTSEAADYCSDYRYRWFEKCAAAYGCGFYMGDGSPQPKGIVNIACGTCFSTDEAMGKLCRSYEE